LGKQKGKREGGMRRSRRRRMKKKGDSIFMNKTARIESGIPQHAAIFTRGEKMDEPEKIGERGKIQNNM
jgi:hypothetical protein